MPKFSIAIPTRNRSHLIGFALRSALQQTHKDFEIVISDNSDDQASKAVVDSLADPRVRYVKTDRVLSMPDNWDNVVAMVSGEWIIVLEDDCVLASRCLELVNQALGMCETKLVTFDWYGYYTGDYKDTSRTNQFVRRPFSGRVRRESGRKSLENLFAFRFASTMPRPYNAVTHHSLIDALKTRLGRVFPPPAPDYTFLTAVLGLVDEFTYIDMPLMLSSSGVTPPSSINAYETFIAELDEQKRGGFAPVRIPVVQPWSIVAESMWRIKEAMPELADVPYDKVRYYVDLEAQLREYGDRGFDISDSMKRYREHLARESIEVRTRVVAQVTNALVRRRVLTRVKAVLLTNDLFLKAAAMITRIEVWRGGDRGFGDIVGAMEQLEAIYPPLQRV